MPGFAVATACSSTFAMSRGASAAAAPVTAASRAMEPGAAAAASSNFRTGSAATP